jgi:hypothetical protein
MQPLSNMILNSRFIVFSLGLMFSYNLDTGAKQYATTTEQFCVQPV